MTAVTFEGTSIPLNEGESVLDGLLRRGFDVPHGCRAGACQACMMRADEGTVPAVAQIGLKESHKQLGYFLSCRCIPQESLSISIGDQNARRMPATVLAADRLSAGLLRVRLTVPFPCRAGQFVTVWRDSHTARSYSIASVPELDHYIELHIKRIAEGKFSAWAYDELTAGDELILQGPLGQCIYVPGDAHQPLLLAGIGTGLAPLYGIVREALRQGHRGSITWFIGARDAANFYLQEELLALEQQYDNLHIRWVALTGASSSTNAVNSDIYQYVKETYPNTQGVRVFLCGAESFVRKLKKQCFLSGTAMQQIHADAFLPCS